MLDDDHPLLLELASLRQTAARFQHEAHAAAIKLQHHALDASRIPALEHDNARLAHELAVLRAHPDAPPHPAVAHVQELTLALRRLSDKIALTEDTLLERTTQLADTRNEIARARHAADSAHGLAERLRATHDASRARERELEFKARASDEERRLVDRVVQEYANLVRTIEGRNATNYSPAETLQDGKSDLYRLLTTFATESETLHATIANLHAQIASLQITLDAERTAASLDRTSLAQTRTELDKLNLEDQTAAKMVARYMKFSQASTNALQEQITTLRTRHASTIATLELQLSTSESQLAFERARTARLQDALDELCEDLARESYGRRREVALRLALLSREETVAEFLRRWARKARESYERSCNSDAVQEAFRRVVTDAESLLSTLDDDVQFSDASSMSGSLARIALSVTAVDALRSELQDEVYKRLEAVRKISGIEHVEECIVAPAEIIVQEAPSPSIQDSASTSATLLVEEESKAVQPVSPAVSLLDLPTKELGDTPAPADMATPTTPPVDDTPTLLSELGASKYRYDTLQRSFRGCSLALKDIGLTLASSPSSVLRQHLETALARIEDYVEDARVELEIRIADEALTVRGFEMVLSVPGALGGEERAEMEASAWTFVKDGGVGRFESKLGDVVHDVAVVKRVVHGLAMEAEDDAGDGGDAGWKTWTAGLLGASPTLPRAPSPVETFGTVMTSPRLRHATSVQEMRGDDGPLAGLKLRIPMPSRSQLGVGLGVGMGVEEARPRTVSAMYAVGGLRTASRVGLVGLGVSRRGGLGVTGPKPGSSSGEEDVQDLGGVE